MARPRLGQARRIAAINIRGEVNDLGDRSAARLRPRAHLSASRPTSNPKQSGRLQLAMWLTSKNNPLTARVMANRIWYHLFGRGIVATVDNFGALGEPPTQSASCSTTWPSASWTTAGR